MCGRVKPLSPHRQVRSFPDLDERHRQPVVEAQREVLIVRHLAPDEEAVVGVEL